MKRKKELKKLILKVQSELQWPVLEQPHEVPVIRIVSYPRSQSHVILVPDKLQQRSTELDYLHELGHATFCEKVHPVFSASSQFASQGNQRQFLMVVPALNAACDWFICHWQMGLSAQQYQKQIQQGLPVAEEILGEPTLPPLEIILDAALLIAQGIHYLEEPIDCGGVLKTMVDAFLSIPPGQPTLENCLLLVNLLMATYTGQRARLLHEDGYYSWQVYQPSAGSGDGVREAGL